MPASSKKDNKAPASSKNKAANKGASSPKRKTTLNRESSKFKGKIANANQVRFRRVAGIDDLAVAYFVRSNGSDPAYTGGIIPHIESEPSHMSSCGLTLITTLRNPDGTNEPLQKVNKSGNAYPVTVAVVLPDEGVTLSQATTNLSKTMSTIAANECRTEWNYGTPVFLNKGDSSPPTLLPLSHYLVDMDCITIMKRVFEGVDTKEELMNENDNRDEILSLVFGDANEGFQVVEAIEDNMYDEL